MDKILMIIAPNNFRDEEYFVPKEIFEKSDIEVITASKGVDIAKGKLGRSAPVSIDISKAKAKDYAAIVLVGGGGALDYIDDKEIKRILGEARENFVLISAICIAPKILANLGFLEGLKATIFNGDSEQSIFIEERGATYIDEDVVEDKQTITANGPDAAQKFAKKVRNYILYQ